MAAPLSSKSVRTLGVMSDTHGNLLRTQQAVHVLDRMEIDVLLHCGDIGSPHIPPLLARWPTHFVFGNTDRQTDVLRGSIEAAGLVCHDRFGALTLGRRRIAMLHGDHFRLLQSTIAGGDYDLVCCGHTHAFEEKRVNGTLVLNPGALHRARIPSVAVVELATLEVTRIPVP